ncbi:unnamed protein product [Peronospora belbahrii]|uniref:5'-3' exonuclease domain-containing protein n=1 Tax=Peronospora belbahrii TaxID=622444 RepID=A0AAU9LLV0_9STRA|nr:unnamed protein product [Peronospora belbahrii]CAH0517351.1 unnamed protein product [Peronospora belbahrii]
MAHYGRAGNDRMALIVDVDHTITNLVECAAVWHEIEYGTKIYIDEVASSSWKSIWGSDDVESKTQAFYKSKQFETELSAVEGAVEVLKDLRKFFLLLAITDRPRFVEKQTREWLDHHFVGVFDRLVFVDEDNSAQIVTRKKELYDELKVKVAVGSDAVMLAETAKDVEHVVIVGSVPWTKAVAEPQSGVVQVPGWPAAKEVFDQLIEELDLQPLDKVFAGPRLARYTDDLVTVSTRKPAVFYANIINSKFAVQKQEIVRLQASEAAITTAVQVAEILRMQNSSKTTKITTRYALNRPKERGGYRVPKMELVLQRVLHKA